MQAISTTPHLPRRTMLTVGATAPTGGPPGQWRGGNRSTTSAQLLSVRLLVLLIALASVVLLFSARVGADQPEQVVTHVVTRGDTLWSIASTATVEGDDVRATVRHIREINGLDGAMIIPGQRLFVPDPR